jgi:hypothetical protein
MPIWRRWDVLRRPRPKSDRRAGYGDAHDDESGREAKARVAARDYVMIHKKSVQKIDPVFPLIGTPKSVPMLDVPL